MEIFNNKFFKILYKLEILCIKFARIGFICLTINMYYNSIVAQNIDSITYWFMGFLCLDMSLLITLVLKLMRRDDYEN